MNVFFKRTIVLTGVILLTPVCAFAQIMKMEMVSQFHSDKPAKYVELKFQGDATIYNSIIYSGTIVNCEVIDVSEPKRLKRNASFTCIPKTYTYYNSEPEAFKTKIKIKYIRILDSKIIAMNAATSVASFAASKFVPGLGLGINAVEGAIEAEDGERLKSAATNLYEHTPFSYIRKGYYETINIGDTILVRITKNKS